LRLPSSVAEAASRLSGQHWPVGERSAATEWKKKGAH
jgi:hypothetical protein